MTLDATTIDEARRLLARGATQRGVIREMPGRISRGTVSKIARGQYVLKRRARAEGDEPGADDRPVGRCQCGRLVKLPCLACRLERHGTPRRIAEAVEQVLADLGLDLSPADRARYDEVHAAKLAEDPQLSRDADPPPAA